MNHFLKYTITCLTTLLLMGCGHSRNGFAIEGEMKGMKSGELYIYTPSDPNAPIDTLKIVEGRFKYVGETYDTIPYIILFPNAVEQVVFVSPGKTITYQAATNDLKNYKVRGTDENELMTDFRKDISDANETEAINTARQYILKAPESIVSLYLLDRYFLQSKSPNLTDVSKLIKTLKQFHPTNHLIYSAEGVLTHTDIIAEGKQVKNVELMLLSRETRKLWNTNSTADYTVIFFWASWLRGGYDILFKIRNMERSYRGSCRFVGISLDNQRYRWEELVRRDSVTIEQYCDGLSWSSPIVSQMAVEAIPCYLIVDKSHKVIFKSDDLEKLMERVKKL